MASTKQHIRQDLNDSILGPDNYNDDDANGDNDEISSNKKRGSSWEFGPTNVSPPLPSPYVGKPYKEEKVKFIFPFSALSRKKVEARSL